MCNRPIEHSYTDMDSGNPLFVFYENYNRFALVTHALINQNSSEAE